jgi:metal-responsive CopG/Arc/MetJ family transcriptional regulator
MTPVKRTRTERLQVVLSADEIAAVDEFRFHTRKPSRAAAVRELLRRGLENEDQLSEPARPKGRQQ